jgi:hypothetical protein
MEDKTPIYILMIVGMVALVAIVYMLAKPGVNANMPANSVNQDNGITAHAVTDNIEPVSIGSIGRFLLGVVLIGAAIYVYKQW